MNERERYTHYIVIGGSQDGAIFPRTAAGLESARQADGNCIRPAVPVAESQAEDWQDWEDWECDIDWGNAAAYIKP